LIIGATLALVGCASAPPQRTVFVERKVYVFVPEKSGPPVPLGEGIAPSPLLVEAEQRREEHEAKLTAAEAREPTIVYVPTPNYGWRAPYPSSVIVVSERHRHGHGARHKAPSRAEKRSHERAAERCGRRGTQWAREKCARGAARR